MDDNFNGELNLGELPIYLNCIEPGQKNYFVFSKEISGFGTVCERKDCNDKVCEKSHCEKGIKAELTELVFGKEVVKTLKLTFANEGKLWLWFGPVLRKICSLDKKLYLEILTKEKIENCKIDLQLVIAEDEEFLGSFDITENIKVLHQWNKLVIPFGIGGFELNWFKLNKPGTLSLEIKIIPLGDKSPKGSIYFKSLAIK